MVAPLYPLQDFKALYKYCIIIIIIIFLPSVAYDPEGFQRLDRLEKNYKISWNDLPPYQHYYYYYYYFYYYYYYYYIERIERGKNIIELVQEQ